MIHVMVLKKLFYPELFRVDENMCSEEGLEFFF
jgi:hypothetical protein